MVALKNNFLKEHSEDTQEKARSNRATKTKQSTNLTEIVMTTFEEKNIVGIIINDPAIIKNSLILSNFLWTVGMRAEDLP